MLRRSEAVLTFDFIVIIAENPCLNASKTVLNSNILRAYYFVENISNEISILRLLSNFLAHNRMKLNTSDAILAYLLLNLEGFSNF